MATLALTSCASFTGRAGATGANGQLCADARYPLPLPPASAVVDSAALLRELARDPSWQRAGTFALLSLTYDPSGDAAYPVLLATSLGPIGKQRAGAGVEDRVREVATRPEPADSVWGVRLRLEGAPPRLTVQPQEYCQPRALGSVSRYVTASRARQTLTISDRPAYFGMEAEPPARAIRLRALVEADGTVSRVIVGASDLLTTEQARDLVEQTAHALTFLPARRDGTPEPAWTTLYATLTTR